LQLKCNFHHMSTFEMSMTQKRSVSCPETTAGDYVWACYNGDTYIGRILHTCQTCGPSFT